MDRYAEKYLRARKIPSTACSGCGLGQVHKKVIMAIDELGLGPDDVVWGTGIGCSGRQTFNTWKGDNFAGTHGRVYALAAGLRLALPPEKKIILFVGDGDAFGIGLLHLLHDARRNIDMTVIVADNFGYQSTGGQFGWTTPEGYRTDSSPYGMREANWVQNGIDILQVLKDSGATFLARHTSFEGQPAVEDVRRAIENPGFSLVHFLYPCVTNFGARALGTRNPEKVFDWFSSITGPEARAGKEETRPVQTITGTEDPHFSTGVFYDASGSRPEFAESLRSWTGRVEEAVGDGR